MTSRVSVIFRSSKVHPRRKGTRRTLGCTCPASPSTIPVELVFSFKKAFEDKFGDGKPQGDTRAMVATDGFPASELKSSWQAGPGQRGKGSKATRHGDPGLSFTHESAGLSLAQQPGVPQRARATLPTSKTKGSKPSTTPTRRSAKDLREAVEDIADKSRLPWQLELANKLGAETPKWVKACGRSKVLHLVEPADELTSSTWRTMCGWPFARRSHFTVRGIEVRQLSHAKIEAARLAIWSGGGALQQITHETSDAMEKMTPLGWRVGFVGKHALKRAQHMRGVTPR